VTDPTTASPAAPLPSPARHVVLVGMMGSGKTTVGRRVAKRLDRPFLDADLELEARTGRSVREWFAAEGEDGFRRAESELLVELLAEPQPSVIAAGGGVVVRAENRAALAGPFVVFLDGDPAFLAGRVAQKEHRPLIDDDVAGTIERLHAERAAWYLQVADEVVAVTPVHRSSESPKRDLADLIAALVRGNENGALRPHAAQ
jgi:shikimate kinase